MVRLNISKWGLVAEAVIRISLSEPHHVLSVSEGVQSLLGFAPEAFLAGGVHLDDRIHPHDADVRDAIFSVYRREGGGSFNLRLRHADGHIRCVRAVTAIEADVDCERVLCLTLQDVHSLPRNLDRRDVPLNLRALMECTEEFVYFKDRNHVFTAANEKVRLALVDPLRQTADVLGLTDYDLFPEEYADRFYRLEKEIFAGRPMAHEVQRSIRKDGTEIWVDNRKFPVKDDSGTVIGLLGIARQITDPAEAEASQRESEESLREAQRIAGLGSYVLDVTADAWTASDLLNEILGIGKTYEHSVAGWTKLIHPQDRAMMLHHLKEEVLGQGKPFCKEYRIVRQNDGAERWVHGLGRLELDKQSRPLLRGTIQDITERKRAEAELHESRELLQLFIQHAPAALAMFDREMRYLAASRRWIEMHGLGGTDLIGLSHYEALPEVPEDWRAAHRRALAGEATEPGDYLFHRADGRSQWVHREVRPWFTGDGQVGGVIIFSEDITRQKLADERLHLAASVFTHAAEGIVITDANGDILDVNDAFTRITGYARHEVLGRNPRFLKSDRQSKEFYDNMWRQLIENGKWSGEIWNRAKGGRIFAETLTISAVPGTEGKPTQYVAHFSDLTSIKEQERKLERIFHYDLLTGLPNRALLRDRLHQAMAQAHRRGRMMALVCLDLDNFKAVNDRHGHNIGDQLLTAATHRMKLALREDDTLARLDGDEFVAVLQDLDCPADGEPIVEQLLRAASEPALVSHLVLQVSASAGVAFFPQADDMDADQLLRQANQALYHAKLEGKNRYYVFDSLQDRSVRGHHEDVERIRVAMEAGEFVLHYQPKVNMRTGAILGAEALLRWQHPERGLLLPGQFLQALEGDRLTIEIGEWVIKNTLIHIERWAAEGLKVSVSVNVAAQQLQQPDFVERLGNLLAAHPGVPRFALELEVLESSALQDVGQISQVMRACEELGVSFALDDFGTGYSSLSYLKRLPVEVLKIDKAFVHDMLDDPEDLTILEGVLVLAAAFRRLAVAEGVESLEHGLMLLRLGCQLGQGHGIAQPMSASELPAWVATWRPYPQWASAAVIGAADRPLLYAIVEHRAWIAAIEDFLRGERGTAPALDPAECRFGAWLQAKVQNGRDWPPVLHQIDALHRTIHARAVTVLACKYENRQAEAMAGLGELHTLRDELLEKVDTLILSL